MQYKLISLALGMGFGAAGMAGAAPVSTTQAGEAPPQARKEMPADPAHAALLGQARLWQARARDDLAIEALNKLLRSAPDHPQGTALLASVHLRGGQKDKASQLLARLRQKHPAHPETARLETLLRLEEGDKERLREARMLGRSGRPEQALKILDQLYRGAPPTPELALEYWQTVADTANGWERALAGLSRLANDNPESHRHRLALAEHITVRRPADPAALKTITELARLPQSEKAARSAWRRALLRLDATPSSISLIEQYLQREQVEDSAVGEHLARLKSELAQRRRLMADPYYRAGLDGLALLDDGKLAEAEAKLLQANAGRPDDVDVIGALGLLRLRQGHHAEAQAYLQDAQRRAPDSSRWTSLLRTARYWGLVREAGDAEDAGEFALAADKLEQARAIDAREPAAIVAMARALAGQGRAAEAEKTFHQALALAPGNADALRGLAALYLRSGRDAQADALLARLSGAQRNDMGAALASLRAALFKEKAEQMLAAGRQADAAAMLERAAAFDADDPWLRLDLARLYAARGEAGKGHALFSALLARHPEDAAAQYAHALFLSNQEQDMQALSTLENIARGQRNESMGSLQRRLWMKVVAQRARQLASDGRGGAARKLLDQAGSAVGDDLSLQLALADARIDAGDTAGARAALARLATATPPSADWNLQLARLTAGAGADDAVPALLDRIDQPTPEQAETASDIRTTLALRRADRLRGENRGEEALALLAPLRAARPGDERLLAAGARLHRGLEDYDRAQQDYRELLKLRPQNRDAAIGLIEVLIADREVEEARQRTAQQLADLKDATPDQRADLIGILIDLHDWDGAAKLAAEVDAEAVMPGNPRALAYASQLAEREGRLDAALDYLRRSQAAAAPFALSTLRPAMPDGSVPNALELVPVPGAAAAGGGDYRRTAELLDRNTSWFASAFDRRSRSGTKGISQYDAVEIPLEWKQAEGPGGRWVMRADLVTLDAGRLNLAEETFGSCAPQAPCGTGHSKQRASGVALNAGLEKDGKRYDIGTTPLGFPVQSLVGGMLHKGDLGPFGYSVDLSRRPITGSVLSYAGARDPRNGRTWGGVLANGVRFGLSLDQGGWIGGWASLGLHRLTGRNVQSNDRAQLMSGVNLRIINEDDRLFQVGLTGMVWRMSENAGEYTFGHGGYYSPRRYASLSLPVTFAQRFARFSYSLRASVSTAHSSSSDASYFPTERALRTAADAIAGTDAIYRGDSGRSSGRSLALSWEYQLQPRLFVGGRLGIERSSDYSPNRAAFYLRYALERNAASPVSLQPEPIGPTSQY